MQIAVIELPASCRPLLLPSTVRRVEQPRSQAQLDGTEPDLIEDEDCYSEDAWADDSDYTPLEGTTNNLEGSSTYTIQHQSQGAVREVSSPRGKGNLQAGKIIHLWDLLPHPSLSPEQLYLIDENVMTNPRQRELRPSYSAPHASSSPASSGGGGGGEGEGQPQPVNDALGQLGQSLSGFSGVDSGSTFRHTPPPSRTSMISRSEPLPGTFPVSNLSRALQPGMYEIWVVTEFADKGSLEDYIVNGQLVRYEDGNPNLVSFVIIYFQQEFTSFFC